MRTIVDLPDKDLGTIKALARRKNISQAEAIRRAVRSYLEAQAQATPSGEAFGLWSGRKDGVTYQRDLRDEWSR